MSVYYYDDALLYKFKEVFENTVFSPTDRAFQRAAEVPPKRGEISFPLISIYRESYAIQMQNFNWHARHRGQMVQYDNYARQVKMEKMIPVRINYQVDIWGKEQRKTDKLLEEILFWITDFPNVEIIAPIMEIHSTPEDLSADIYYLHDQLPDENTEYITNDTEYEEQFRDYSVYSYYKFLNVIIIEDKIAYRTDLPDCIKVSEEEWQDCIDYIKEEIIDTNLYQEVSWEELVEDLGHDKVPLYQTTIVIDQDLQDNSDILSFEEIGRVYRLTFPFYITKARLMQQQKVFTVLDIRNWIDDVEVK